MIRKDEGLRRVCRNYEQVENYSKAIADEERWELHHRREIDENKSRQQLIDEGKYYDVAAEELIFLTKAEHTILHKKGNQNTLGKHHSEAAKQKMSEVKKGENHPFYGKHHSEAAKQKMSEAKSGEKHPFFGKHHSADTKKKMQEARKEMHWWNNGVINKRSKELPGPDFVRGRLK